MDLFETMGETVRQLNNKYNFVILDLIEHSPGYVFRNPIVPKVVLGNGSILPQDLSEFPFYLFFDCFSKILSPVENIDASVCQVEFLQMLPASTHSSKHFIHTIVF